MNKVKETLDLKSKKQELERLEKELNDAHFIFGKKSQSFFEKHTQKINQLSEQIVLTKIAIRDAEENSKESRTNND